MKIDEIGGLLGKRRSEVEEMLKRSDVIELNLSERKPRQRDEDDDLRIYE